MANVNRAFTVIELGKSGPATDIRLPAGDAVEVVDLTTRAISHVKAATVSMYRHALRWNGKSYNILNIQDIAQV